MAPEAPGQSHREGLSNIEMMDMFPAEEAATRLFEARVRHGVLFPHETVKHSASEYVRGMAHTNGPHE